MDEGKIFFSSTLMSQLVRTAKRYSTSHLLKNSDSTPQMLTVCASKVGKPRPIIVQICFLWDRENVWSSLFKLKGTHIIINKNFSQSITRKRNALYLVYKQAKEQELKTRLVGDKLHIVSKIDITETIHQVTSEVKMRQKLNELSLISFQHSLS